MTLLPTAGDTDQAGKIDVIIVGAGISGLLAAQTLAKAGIAARILDKGRSVGGRLATRRIGQGKADHGAQFFSVRDPEFAALVEEWVASGLVYQWSTGWSDGSLAQAVPDGHPRYAVRDGMNSLAKFLAQQAKDLGVTISIDTRAAELRQSHDGWQVHCEGGATYAAGTVVLTSPVPQSLALLDATNAVLPQTSRAALDRIAYAPCLCLLVNIEGQANLPEPGARQTPQAVVTWIADNRRKGISPAATVLTIHAGPEYSLRNYSAPDDQVREDLLAEVRPLLSPGAEIRDTEVKRWRYALPTVTHPHRYHFDALPAPLYFGGDAFGGPRIEGAALSGLAIGHAIAAA